MSAQQRNESTELVRGIALGESAPHDHDNRLAMGALPILFMIGISLVLAAAAFVLNPEFADVSNQGRLHLMGWSIFGAMALVIIVPVKTKSPLLWMLYLLLFIPVVYMIHA